MATRPSTAAPIIACLIVSAVLFLMIYVGGYYLLMMGPADTSALGDPIRVYRYRWLAYAFYPAAYLEGRATGRRVLLVGGRRRNAAPLTQLLHLRPSGA